MTPAPVLCVPAPGVASVAAARGRAPPGQGRGAGEENTRWLTM